MKIMKKIITLSIAVLTLVVLGANISFAGKPTGGGKGGKVTVEFADPSSAIQGEEPTVTIMGSGFDDGSSVKFLVTGTTDESQIVVDSVTYVSPSQLKAHIKTNSSTATVGYDIEVQATSGRKGKGTTLFKVQQAEAECTGSEPRNPEIVYLTAFDMTQEIHTQDIYLSTGSGCDQYLLLDDAVELLPTDGGPRGINGEYLKAVTGLRLDVEGNVGVVTWTNTALNPSPQMGILFSFDSLGNVVVEQGGASEIYSSEVGADVKNADVRFNDLDQLELIVVERLPGEPFNRFVVFNPDTKAFLALGPTSCVTSDKNGNCYPDTFGHVHWSNNGDQIYFQSFSPQLSRYALARFQNIGGIWQQGEVLVTHQFDLQFRGVSSTGILAYRYYEQETNKRGKVLNRIFYTAVINPGDCESFECSPAQGTHLALDIKRHSGGWTNSGGLLFLDVQAVDKANIREYSNPITGETSDLNIVDVDYYESDTSF